MRKARAEKRIPIPDPIYRSRLVSRTINNIMQDGKKDLAQRILYLAFEMIRTKTDDEPLKTFNKAIENIVPSLELKVRRIGGANYQIPVEVSDDRKTTLALRWLIHFARLRNEKTMVKRLAGEIIDASKGIGASVKKRDDTHKMAEANKAFAHYRW